MFVKINISNEYDMSLNKIYAIYVVCFANGHVCVKQLNVFLIFLRDWITDIQYVFKSNTEEKLDELDQLWEKSKPATD